MRLKIGVLLSLLFIFSAPLSEARGESIHWMKSLKATLKQAKTQPKLIMIDFYADWCTWCKRLDTDTYVDKRVVKLCSQLYAVKLNTEDGGEGTEFARQFAVRGLPAILFLDSKGALFASMNGYRPPDSFSEELGRMLKLNQEIPNLKARVLKKDGAAAARLAMVYASQKKTVEVESLISIAEPRVPNDENLLTAYNALGANFGMTGEYARAIPYFKKVIQRSKNPAFTLLANFRTGLCYTALKLPKSAQPYLEKIIADPQAPPQMKNQAQRVLQQNRL